MTVEPCEVPFQKCMIDFQKCMIDGAPDWRRQWAGGPQLEGGALNLDFEKRDLAAVLPLDIQ